MKKNPLIEYKIAIDADCINKDDKIWNEKVPVDRHGADAKIKKTISYGSFFLGVEEFLSEEDFINIKKIIFKKIKIKNSISVKDIKKISICLIKHGAFYHPCYINVSFKGINSIHFILNVAVSKLGREFIVKEYNFLKNIKKKNFSKYLPEVYCVGDILTPDKYKLSMFAGKWFDNYHEFHLSYINGKNLNGKKKIIVWDDKRGNYYLSSLQEKELYRQITMIIVEFYDIKNCKQIMAWHHAAGDFIVNCTDNFLDVKLITVREYDSQLENDASIEAMFNTLLLFFLNLSVNIRLDRIDGIGNLSWSNDVSVDGFILGFFDGLAVNESVTFHKVTIADLFGQYLMTLDYEYIHDTIKGITLSYNFNTQDALFVMDNLENHVNTLFNRLQKYFI